MSISSRKVGAIWCKALAVSGLFMFASIGFQAQAWAAKKPFNADPWQMKRLFSPSKNDLVSEEKGHIIIYSGLLDTEVDHALDLYFNRIESMMFIKTIRTDANGKPEIDSETGEVVVADDGC